MKIKKEIMDQYREILQRVWRRKDGNIDEKMVDYCIKKTATLAVLPNGYIIPIDKQSIEKHFCFDDSYDYEGAQKKARHAATSEDYFMRENMRDFADMVEAISDADETAIARTMYNSDVPESRLKALGYIDDRDTMRIKAEHNLTSLERGKEYHSDWHRANVYILTDEDREIVKAAMVEAMKEHEKKCRAYLKRYGMEHVKTWTYWGEA